MILSSGRGPDALLRGIRNSEPGRMQTTSTVFHIPHSSVHIPDHVRDQYVITAAALELELILMTDRYTDELFDVRQEGVARIVYPVSRLVVDPERFRDDVDEPMAERGMGAVYFRTARGEALRRLLQPDEGELLLERYYDPHHAALTRIVTDSLNNAPNCLIVDGHSFPSMPLPCDRNQTAPRPDICIGTDPFHTPSKLVDLAEKLFLSRGWTVGIDWPYTGTLVPVAFYHKVVRVEAIMVEINRRLYMNEVTGEKLPGFDAFRGRFQRCLEKIVRGEKDDRWRDKALYSQSAIAEDGSK